MAKPKGNPGIQNRHIYTRASYLYQAASYLASCAQQTKKGVEPEKARNEDRAPSSSIRGTSTGVAHDGEFVHSAKERKAIMNLSHQVISDMRSVSLKAQIRQSPSIKQTICRYCDSVQIEGKTCGSTVENLSKGGRKPWADVLATRCDTCGNVKRYPISAPRQKRRPLRTPGTPKMEKNSTSTPPAPSSARGLPT
ncbi:rnase p rpr2 rpp21 subunit domain-containing [Trichoderma arundinaceum]|uniref:Rnase p rpr2 rpp21 subunit domain-containing n=1 Tax=Trichoderma arundinaceum TaxID=490622 RepID=A0A395NZQ6_TRIAR|nr:rnase p rpr2 rpp21 subunit domain-containing [Trichoderma arundinaceum]